MTASLAAPLIAFAQGDVALVDLVSGDVTYGPNRAKVSAFMKVREGDRFNVARGGQVRLLYFNSAQQEHFAGPAAFTAGRESSAQQSGSKPRVSKVPSGVPQRIARIPELLQNAKLGGVQIRSKPPAKADDALREARALYQQMRKERRKDDITPELFLYSTLSDYHRYDEMRPVVEEMLRRQPNNEEVKALAASVK
ncbi:MAG: hypothetical protein ACREUE_16075 [Panacagrimonas sp.]